MEVFAANGEILRVSPEEHPDLYWALSGGGGGTYAAVLSLAVEAYPDDWTTAAKFTFSVTESSQKQFFAGIEAYVAALPSVLDAGATSIWLNNNETFILSPAVGIGMSKTRMDQLHQPILE